MIALKIWRPPRDGSSNLSSSLGHLKRVLLLGELALLRNVQLEKLIAGALRIAVIEDFCMHQQ
jgi:hypothetical protein